MKGRVTGKKHHRSGNSLVSVLMLARDEASNIKKAINSVKSIADEILVLDTGSKDNTIKIAMAEEVDVVMVPWENDFSKARNMGLKMLKGKWILVLNADESLDLVNQGRLLRITKTPGKIAYRVKVSTYDIDGQFMHNSSELRLFPNVENLRYEGIVHEDVAQSLNEQKISILDEALVISHLDGGKDKALRLIKIIESHQSDDVQTLFALAENYRITEEIKKSRGLYQSLLEDKQNRDMDIKALCALRIGEFEYLNGKLDVSKNYHRIAMSMLPENPLPNFYLGQIYEQEGEYYKAMDYFAKTCHKITQDKDSERCYGHIYLRCLYAIGLICENLEQEMVALKTYRKIKEVFPHEMDARRKIAYILYDKGQWLAAIREFSSIQKANSAIPSDYMALADCHKSLGNSAKERDVIFAGTLKYKHDKILAKKRDELRIQLKEEVA